MRRVLSATDAKNRFADALRQAENGDLVLIARGANRWLPWSAASGWSGSSGSSHAALLVGSHDFTTEFHRAAGAPTHSYLTDRRLEAAARLLLDTELPSKAIACLVGYRSLESLPRAFSRRYGVRPSIYRELEGKPVPAVAADAAIDRRPVRAPAGARAGRDPEAAAGRHGLKSVAI